MDREKEIRLQYVLTQHASASKNRGAKIKFGIQWLYYADYNESAKFGRGI